MWGGVSLNDHIMLVHNKPDAAEADAAEADAADADAAEAGAACLTDAADADAADAGAACLTDAADVDAADGADADDTVKPGDCLEVWWDNHKKWYPCVVKDQAEDADSTTASLCLYDDEGQWHNLDNESFRRIPPTQQRLSRMTVKVIRARLKCEQITVSVTRKADLVLELLKVLSARYKAGVPGINTPTPTHPHTHTHTHPHTHTHTPPCTHTCTYEPSLNYLQIVQ